ncbi:hypothetical protein EMIT07CA2_550083 [Brevibacillus sp. IT-7CA2]
MKVHLLVSVAGVFKQEHWYDDMVPIPNVGNGIVVDNQLYTVNGVRYEYHEGHVVVKVFI